MATISQNGTVLAPALKGLRNSSGPRGVLVIYVIAQVVAFGVVGGNLFASAGLLGNPEFSAGGFLGGAVVGLIATIPALAIYTLLSKILETLHEQFDVVQLQKAHDATVAARAAVPQTPYNTATDQ